MHFFEDTEDSENSVGSNKRKKEGNEQKLARRQVYDYQRRGRDKLTQVITMDNRQLQGRLHIHKSHLDREERRRLNITEKSIREFVDRRIIKDDKVERFTLGIQRREYPFLGNYLRRERPIFYMTHVRGDAYQKALAAYARKAQDSYRLNEDPRFLSLFQKQIKRDRSKNILELLNETANT